MQTNSSIFGSLTSEINQRTFLGLITVVVLITHILVVLRLLEPTDKDKEVKPPKVVEVVLLPKPEPVIPKEKAAPPAKPAEPKKVVPPKKQPPKKIVKPPVKQEMVEPKKVVLPKAKPTEIPDLLAPALSAPTKAVQKSVVLAPVGPASKSGNGDANSKGTNSGVVALVRVKPAYPARAASRHLEGWVKIQFTVSAAGTVTNPSVVSASPPGIFDEAALDAIRRWKFKPRLVNGVATTQQAVQTLKFTLTK